jgi:hypothetical protein
MNDQTIEALKHWGTNQIVVKFMGGLYNVHSEMYGIGKAQFVTYGSKKDLVMAQKHYKVEELQYHSSWDWLNEVIDRIERKYGYATELKTVIADSKTQYSFRITDSRSIPLYDEVLIGDEKMKVVYDSVVAFIKWFDNIPRVYSN